MNWLKSSKSVFQWNNIKDEFDLKSAIEFSYESPILILKHSTRCSISSMAKNRIENGDRGMYSNIYLLDLIKFRDISNKISEQFDVMHQSPQLLKISNGKCTYHASHQEVSLENIID